MVLIGDDFWKAKICAFLHDSPDKQIVLFHTGTGGHERVASQLIEALEIGPDDMRRFDDLARAADHLAAGSDRPPIPQGYDLRVDFQREPTVIHPLSGDSYEIQALDDHDWKAVSGHVLRVVTEIGSKYDSSNDRASKWALRYLSLWRELRPRLQRESRSERLGALWALLPADSRVPDHNIWDHLRLTSALAGAIADNKGEPNGEACLLALSIGPVQSFIAAARKTRDLWAGSWILSWLSWSAMRPIVGRLGPDCMIFPDLWGQPLVDRWLQAEMGLGSLGVSIAPLPEQLAQASLPNRFLAVVPRPLAKELALAACASLNNSLKLLAERSIAAVLGNDAATLSETSDLAARQLQDYFQTAWAAIPWPRERDAAAHLLRKSFGEHPGPPALRFDERLRESAAGFWRSNHSGALYADLYHLAERSLAATKRSRTFLPASIPPGPRCSQTGELAPVVRGPARSDDPREDITIPESPDLAEGERLSAVILIKRALRKIIHDLPDVNMRREDFLDLRFPSTGSIAAAPWLEKLADASSPQVAALASQLGRNPSVKDQGQAVPERTHVKLKRSGLRDLGYLDARVMMADEDCPAWLDEDGVPVPDDVRKSLAAVVEKHGRPSPYFALILADGDSMGQWLAGQKAPRILDCYHNTIRQRLQERNIGILQDAPRPLSPALHASVSGALRNFSRDVLPLMVEEFLSGKLIYSGGDDVLALISLRDVLPILVGVPSAFSGITGPLDACFNGRFKDGFAELRRGSHHPELRQLMGSTASISGAVVIAHQKMPFQAILSAAREAEARAKNVEEKSAVSINVLKHSGERLELLSPWFVTVDGQDLWLASILDMWISAFGPGAVLSLPERSEPLLKLSPTLLRAVVAEIGPAIDAVEVESNDAQVLAMDFFAARTMRDVKEIDGARPGLDSVRACLLEPTLRFVRAVSARTDTRPGHVLRSLLAVALFFARHPEGVQGRNFQEGSNASA